MAEGILFIFEGKIKEPQIYKNMASLFFKDKNKVHIYTTFKTVIYTLWKEINKIGFIDDINIIDLLKEYDDECRHELSTISSRNISQIYLFFDHDGHATNASDDKLKEMVEYFDNEFDKGKLFISYPMAESLQDLQGTVPFQNKVFPIVENQAYKKTVRQTTIYNHINQLDMDCWNILLEKNSYKANLIVEGAFSKPEVIHSQPTIFQHQLEKHIIPNAEVSILSAFPLFLIDYFGLSLIEK
jgi:hypothetical protein